MRRAACQLGRLALVAAEQQSASVAPLCCNSLLANLAAAASFSSSSRLAAPSNHHTLFSSRGYAANSHDIFNQHKDTPDNNAESMFEWTEVSGRPVKLADLPRALPELREHVH